MPISPNQGSTGGGTVVTITGVNLSGATAVTFGTKPGTITANTPTFITVISPSGSGTVNVTVTTPGGTSNPLAFYYVGAPFKATLSSSSGPEAGGNTVTIAGTGLSTATSVAFGANSATPTVVSDSVISVVVPAGATGSVGVTVTTVGGSNNGLSYTYVTAPTATSTTPDAGPTSGGTAVTVTGNGLTTTQSVTVGGTVAPFAVISDTEVSLVTPPGTAGAADVVLTTTGGSATLIGGFTYTAGPGI
ncbi:IPT/TIG domain-containing protein [Actinospica durhamensis]|uniref:IPT/TIG domain-containing protein n=1 Tax=Actinospica durhamensis TaxID=1508375 RepID=A0A941ESX2_9ACTN|nr:IPT/TIG domain-containing protein [Actinospica durhamensis]MBR7836603.1 IPT/TIG domain-containing protein [Actinospica durhamensis]